ncbi:PH domain containing protein [Acanthamoeba castellanii str. Neff]|uniref:Kinase n=1 Tax=Acanthamoeba castellanii (strain ATCC 30010 / Neff) TaxID=1257118 RepID=L8HD20_ACACF|nr:PH domain containing protein [Acanthamoeba castellanii str. Neff]ELR23075.1 PH domain containing protein [Acanthamoeba castellanii str. Neff]
MERGEWKELADIVPQGDGALVVSLASSPSARASAITNQELRTQWETTFKRNTKRWTAQQQQRDAHSTASLRSSRSEGVALSPTASRREIARKKNESEDKREESDKEEVVRKWVPSACTGAELRRRLTIEETIQLLSEEVNRCVLKSQAQLQHRGGRSLVASAGDPSFLPTSPASSSSLQLLNSGESHFHTTTTAAMDKPHQPLQLRPLRSPKEVLAGLGRSSGGSAKKAKAAGRKGRAVKTAGTDEDSCGGDLGGWDPLSTTSPPPPPPAGSEDEAKVAVVGSNSRATVVMLRGEVPEPDVYYFAKRNVREGWLVKQGGRVQSWKKRYFILRPTNGEEEPGMLYYFERLPFKNANTPAKGALLMREVTSVDENDLPGKPFSFALCTLARKFWFQAASVEEKVAWTQAFSAFVLENLSTSLEKVELTSDRRTQDKLYVSHDDRPSVLKPLVDREEAIYYRLDRAREEVASFPVRLFCFSSGVTLIEGKEYLCLEDPLHHMKRPSVCRLRLGAKSRGEAGQDASLGFKFEQIQVYHRATDQYVKKSFPRKSGNKKAEKATKELLRFLYDGERIHYAVVDVLLARLAELILWLERDARGGFLPFLLLKPTLLLAYDTAEPDDGEAIQLKIMDFEHCKPKPAGQEVHSLSFLNGVRRLCKLLDRIYYEKSLADKVARK